MSPRTESTLPDRPAETNHRRSHADTFDNSDTAPEELVSFAAARAMLWTPNVIIRELPETPVNKALPAGDAPRVSVDVPGGHLTLRIEPVKGSKKISIRCWHPAGSRTTKLSRHNPNTPFVVKLGKTRVPRSAVNKDELLFVKGEPVSWEDVAILVRMPPRGIVDLSDQTTGRIILGPKANQVRHVPGYQHGRGIAISRAR